MEIWKAIEGYEGLYEVSNHGRVRRFYKDGYRQIKPFKTTKDYYSVTLHNRKRFDIRIHRLVALAFIPNPDNKPQLNHIDCNKANNCVSNLEWCTNSENQTHALQNGLKSKKLTDEDVYKIKQLLFENKMTQRAIAKMFSVTYGLISMIKHGKRWTHI